MVRVIDVIFRIELYHSYNLINFGHHCYIKQTHKVSYLRGLCVIKFLQLKDIISCFIVSQFKASKEVLIGKSLTLYCSWRRTREVLAVSWFLD